MNKKKLAPIVPECKPSHIESLLINGLKDSGPVTTEFGGEVKTILDPKKRILMRDKDEY